MVLRRATQTLKKIKNIREQNFFILFVMISTRINDLRSLKIVWHQKTDKSLSRVEEPISPCPFKLTSVFLASVLLLIMNFVITLSK